MASISFFQCLYRIIMAFTRALVFSIFPAPKKAINDEIVLITGSAGVLGRALAVEFSKYGAFLCLWDIDEEENQKTYELLYTQYNHRRMVAMKVDITIPEEIHRAAEKIRYEIGNVSIVVQNAGVVTCKNILDLNSEDIKRTFNVNIISHYHINQAFLPAMIERHYGHIVAITSNCGLFGLSHLGDYCASKFAIIGYMESVEDEIYRSKCSGVNTTIAILGPLKGGLNERVREIVIPESVDFLPANICAQRIVQGVITNQKFLYIPKTYRLLELIKSFLPYDAFKAILSYVLNVHDPNLKRNRLRKATRS
ncbi:unnamed protein product [Adineta steineri]|uniref:Uncharacterized protein n=1 Tax=Adineta steineri TaxID=433720 RepID=A0A818P106_9BILA|nr:unnamed protein product [Adineta steineri]CAF1346916.1 unnamed protein product [Adineta steineri]CAF3613103.1 unnamed protein product [Adineta steineri]CAF4005793.1 unnamed protein product [Adineta steineri]